MTQKEMVSLAQRQLEAYNVRDIEAFARCFHPEVNVSRLSTNTIVNTGIEEFKKGFRMLFESSPLLHCELKSRIVLASTVIDEEWVTGAKKYPDGLHAVAIYGFRDGLIDRIWFPG